MVAALLAAACLGGCQEPESAPDAAQPAADAAASSEAATVQRHFTKQEFDRYASNRTKDQIRAEFGTPMSVHDDLDTWVYSNLPIYDAEAGTREMVSIRFAGVDGPQDFVVDTSYQTAFGG
jgi:outer membrane protein assembly factor BamE (lipoprotein component of BamABCDE complex)